MFATEAQRHRDQDGFLQKGTKATKNLCCLGYLLLKEIFLLCGLVVKTKQGNGWSPEGGEEKIDTDGMEFHEEDGRQRIDDGSEYGLRVSPPFHASQPVC